MPVPLPAHMLFSDEEKAEINRLFLDGKSKKEIGEIFDQPYRTIGKVLSHLGMERSTAEIAKLAIKSEYDTPEIISKIKELRVSHSFPEMEKILNIPHTIIHRLCERYSISQDNYFEIQSERLKKALKKE